MKNLAVALVILFSTTFSLAAQHDFITDMTQGNWYVSIESCYADGTCHAVSGSNRVTDTLDYYLGPVGLKCDPQGNCSADKYGYPLTGQIKGSRLLLVRQWEGEKEAQEWFVYDTVVTLELRVITIGKGTRLIEKAVFKKAQE